MRISSNIRRNSRKPTLTTYTVGMTLSRLMLPLYIYGCPYNILFFNENTRPLLLVLLCLWMGMQVVCLLVQGLFGPRILLPDIVRNLDCEFVISNNY